MIIKQSFRLSKSKEAFIKKLLIIYALFLLVFAMCNGITTMFSGLITIINSHATLVSDYMIIGGISGAFLNAFLVTVLGLFILFKSKVQLTGVSIAAIFMLSGFALFGKNIMNVIPLMLGVLLHALIYKKHSNRVIYVALFSTALGPIVTEVYLQLELILILRILISYALGLFIGFILTPVSEHALKIHQGFDLYNIGFTDGIVSICVLSLLKMFGFDATPVSMHQEVNDTLFLIVLLIFCAILIILGIIDNPNFIQGQIEINKESGRGLTCFINREGLGSTLVNMGLCGILSTLFMYFMDVPLNGPIYGTIVSIIGFCACGNNLRNIIYIYIASFIGNLIGMWDLSTSVGVALATLLGTGLAPIGGQYGFVAGIISGFVHISVAQFTSPLHLGLNLYNNGFVAGFVAMFLVPFFASIEKLKRKLIIYHHLIRKKED